MGKPVYTPTNPFYEPLRLNFYSTSTESILNQVRKKSAKQPFILAVTGYGIDSQNALKFIPYYMRPPPERVLVVARSCHSLLTSLPYDLAFLVVMNPPEVTGDLTMPTHVTVVDPTQALDIEPHLPDLVILEKDETQDTELIRSITNHFSATSSIVTCDYGTPRPNATIPTSATPIQYTIKYGLAWSA